MAKDERSKNAETTAASAEEMPEEPLSAPPQEVTMTAVGSAELLQGRYSNVAIIRHTQNEFVLDFFFVVQDQRAVVSRVILSADHAKRLHRALGVNLQGYEQKFGTIEIKDSAPE